MPLLNSATRILCQGMTGAAATVQMERSIAYGAHIVAGTTIHRDRKEHLGVPLFTSVAQAVSATPIDASVIFVPAASVMDAVVEAIDAGIRLIVCVTQSVPLMDMMKLRLFCKQMDVTFIGPGCLGVIVPGQSTTLGVMLTTLFHAGNVGIISRAGSLTYEAVEQLNKARLGQSMCVGIGNETIAGSTFIHILPHLEADENTEIILLLGEIGGVEEERAAEYIDRHISKPVVAYIAGATSTSMHVIGHANTLMADGLGTVASKQSALAAVGVTIVEDFLSVGQMVAEALQPTR